MASVDGDAKTEPREEAYITERARWMSAAADVKIVSTAAAATSSFFMRPPRGGRFCAPFPRIIRLQRGEINRLTTVEFAFDLGQRIF